MLTLEVLTLNVLFFKKREKSQGAKFGLYDVCGRISLNSTLHQGQQPPAFLSHGFARLVTRWCMYVEKDEDCVEKWIMHCICIIIYKKKYSNMFTNKEVTVMVGITFQSSFVYLYLKLYKNYFRNIEIIKILTQVSCKQDKHRVLCSAAIAKQAIVYFSIKFNAINI